MKVIFITLTLIIIFWGLKEENDHKNEVYYLKQVGYYRSKLSGILFSSYTAKDGNMYESNSDPKCNLLLCDTHCLEKLQRIVEEDGSRLLVEYTNLEIQKEPHFTYDDIHFNINGVTLWIKLKGDRCIQIWPYARRNENGVELITSGIDK